MTLQIKSISSRENPAAKFARSVRDGKVRSRIFVEGVRLAEEAVDSHLEIEAAFFTPGAAISPRFSDLLGRLSALNVTIFETTESVLTSISGTKTPQGIVLLAARPLNSQPAIDESTGVAPLVLVLHHINNPSNAGAILRTAEAAGVTAVITTTGTTDVFSAKAIRASMGSAFRVCVWERVSYYESLEWCRSNKLSILGAASNSEYTYTETDWRLPTALVMGAEATGLSSTETMQLDRTLMIPMKRPVESLNVAAATAVLLFEAARQRSRSV